MATETYNFNDLTGTDWIKLVNKPVMVGIYRLDDESPVVQIVGNLSGVVIKPTEVKVFTDGQAASWFDPAQAYALISFKGVD